MKNFDEFAKTLTTIVSHGGGHLVSKNKVLRAFLLKKRISISL